MANEKRLIDVKPLMQSGWHLVRTGESNKFLASMSLADVPTVDAVEVVHGRWIFGTTLNHSWMKCSECLHSYGQTGIFVYCPNCGAKMDGGNDDG